jgi:hypothetical protein
LGLGPTFSLVVVAIVVVGVVVVAVVVSGQREPMQLLFLPVGRSVGQIVVHAAS